MKIFHPRIFLILLMALVMAGASGCSKGARIKRILTKANRDFDAERYDDAEIEYKNAFQLGHLNPVAIGQLGRLYVIEGRPFEALKYLSQAVKLAPNSLPFQLALGQVQASLHDTTNAAAVAVRILNYQPTNEDALFLLVDNVSAVPPLMQKLQSIPHIQDNPGYHTAMGMLDLRLQKYAEGEKELRQAAASNSSQAYVVLAELYSYQKKEKEGADALKKAADLAPLRSLLRIKYAEYLIRSGAAADGRKMLQEITDKAPDYIPGWVARMNLALAENNFDEGAKYADTVFNRDPDNYDGLLARGRISRGRGDTTNAVTYLEHLASRYNKNAPAKYELAVAYYENHDIPKCVQSLEAALELDPAFGRAAILLGEVEIKMGEPGAAIEELTKFIKKVPDYPQAQLLLADAYLTEQRPDNAMAVYRSLAKAFPKNPQIPMLMGIVLASQRRNAEARAELNKSLQLDPTYTRAAEQLINLDIIEQKYADASALAQAQIKKNPSAGELWELQAKIDFAQTNLTQGESDLLKAIELSPNLVNAYMQLARAYVGSGKYPEALQKLNALVARTNDASAYLQIAAVHERLKEYDAAAKAYEKVLTIDPRSAVALNDLAYLNAVQLNKVDRGYELAQKAQEIAPNSPGVSDTMGWILVKKGDYTHALALLQDSAEKAPADAEIQYHLGETHYLLGDEDAARAALQRAVSSPQDFRNKDEARKRLDVLNMVASQTGDTLADVEKALRDNPNDPVLLNRIGELQEQHGDFEKAAATYETLHKQNPQSSRAMFKLARLYALRLNQPEKAMVLATAAHKLAPDSPDVSAILGHLVFHSGDYTWSLSLLENAALERPNDPQLLYDLAWAQYSSGRVADAQTTLQKALKAGATKSDDAQQFLDLADAFMTVPKAQAASAQAQKVLQTNAKYVPALMVTGAANESAGNFTAAQSDFSKALDVFPQFAPAQRRLAILDAQHFKNDARGYAMAEKALTAYPDDTEVADSLGILGFYQAKYSRSAEVLQESISNGKSDGELYYCLGMDYYHLRKSKESKQSLQRALDLNLPDKLAVEARHTLSELK